MGAFLGMRGNGDWATDQEPGNFREVILHEYPNGDTPLTALLSMMSSESVDSDTFNWWTKRLPAQAGSITAGQIYIDVGLSTAYVYATHGTTHGADGSTVYAKVPEAFAKECRKGHNVTLIDSDRSYVALNAHVNDVVYNGANSYLALKLLEADDNAGDDVASYNMATVDRIMITSNSNPQGGSTPRGIAYDPTKFYNHTQIFRAALEMTRTAQKTRLRTGDQLKEAQREALELIGIEQEKALYYGIRKEWTGANGQPETTFDGIINFIKRGATTGFSASAASSINDYTLRSDFTGQSWLEGGEDWFDDNLEFLGTYAPSEVIALCGAGALTGLTKLAKYTGNIQMEPGPNNAYGMKFTTWINPHITIHMKKAPMMAREPSMTNSMLLFSPKNIKTKVMDEITYLPDRQPNGMDGVMSEYLGEWGPEYHFPDQFQWLNGIGLDSIV